jgi:hypothetical protein
MPIRLQHRKQPKRHVGLAALSALLLLPVSVLAQEAPAAPPPPAAGDYLPTQPAPGDSVYTEEAIKSLSMDWQDLGFEMHGFVNLEYAALRDDADHPNNTFDIHNVFLSTRAHIGTFAKLFVELEYEHGSTVKLDRAFIDFDVARAFTLRVGRFSSPFSYERVHYAAPVRLMTSRPMLVDIGFHEWVDTGLEAFGRVGAFGYNLAIANGPRGLTEKGIPDQDVVDINENKSVVGRLNFYPTSFLEGGVVGSAGTYDPDDKRWFYLAELDARLRYGRWDIWTEAQYRDGDDEPCNSETDPSCNPAYVGDHANKFGYYVLGSYEIIQDRKYAHYVKALLRFDEIDDLKAGEGKRRITGGFNWSPAAHIVIKSEVQATFSTTNGALGSNGIMLSAVADF